MRKRIGIFGLTEEIGQLLPWLVANPEVEIAAIYDATPETSDLLTSSVVAEVGDKLVTNRRVLTEDTSLYAVVDAGSGEERFESLVPDAADRGLQVVSPLTARLLWGYGAPAANRKPDLLRTLHEVIESYNLTIDTDELFGQMLETARSATGADGGSLMLMDENGSTRALRVRVAVGIEPELWSKIRVPLGEGIAGRVASEARPLRLRGRADSQAFHILHERLDVASALCVPLVHGGRVLGVLNLHHATHPDAFSEEDLEFADQLARLDAQIIARAREHESLRDQASRFSAVRKVQNIVAQRTPLAERLSELCHFAAERFGNGIATLYLLEPGDAELRLTATSLAGGGFGGEYRITLGQGIDGAAAGSREATILRNADGSLAYAALPLLAGQTLVGLLSIQVPGEAAVAARSAATRGRAAEETLLEIAAAAAEGIASARREARVKTQATKIGAINETGIRMISTTDPSEVLRLGTSSASMVLEADYAVLRLRDEQTGRYAIRSFFGSAEGPHQEKLFRLDKQICVDTIKRRAPLLVRDLHEVPALAVEDFGVKSVIAAPLQREGQVIGTLALYDKVSADRFTTGSFHDEDLELFGKFVSYLERAVSNALEQAHTRQFRNFDEETGIPNEAYLKKRIQEEIARAQGRGAALALAICRIENFAALEAAGGSEATRGVARCVADALRAHIRAFDVAGRTAESELTVLLPDPGRDAPERVLTLARAVADDVARVDALNDPAPIELAFGYAIYPADGAALEPLFESAREPRIRMY